MLADLSPSEVSSRYLVSGVEATAEWPSVNLDLLHRQLAEVRQRGFATNFEESERGIAAMAVSVGPVEGEALSMSVALPIARYSDDVGRRISQALLEIKNKTKGA